MQCMVKPQTVVCVATKRRKRRNFRRLTDYCAGLTCRYAQRTANCCGILMPLNGMLRAAFTGLWVFIGLFRSKMFLFLCRNRGLNDTANPPEATEANKRHVLPSVFAVFKTRLFWNFDPSHHTCRGKNV